MQTTRTNAKKKRKRVQNRFQVLRGAQDSLAPTPGAIFLRSRTNTTVTGVYQLGSPRVAQHRCTIAGAQSCPFFFHKRTCFSKCAGNLSSYLIFVHIPIFKYSNGRIRHILTLMLNSLFANRKFMFPWPTTSPPLIFPTLLADVSTLMALTHAMKRKRCQNQAY